MKLIRSTGRYLTSATSSEPFRTFIPHPLPPDPPINLDAEHLELIEKANRSIGRLDGMATLLPDTNLFIYFYVRKEALLSSQIEGTQSSFSDLLAYESDEMPGVPIEDVEEVSSYVAAINHGIKRLRASFPLSLRLIKEVHQILLSTGRGSTKSPGEFRRSQNWLGGTRPGNARFVPPPPEVLMDCMGALEKFLHNEPVRTPVLIKAALTHVQFETIHPFLDGNGRLGRMLITLLLCAEKALIEPLLYLSLYFKENREQYYSHLQQVRESGDWEGWLKFFLIGVSTTADQTVHTSRSILEMFERDSRRIEALGRQTSSALKVYQMLKRKPLVSVPKAVEELGLTAPTVRASIEQMQKLNILRELTGKQRDRTYAYHEYVKILSEGAEP
jgi:Fic family protein